MKNVLKNAIKVASLVTEKKGFATTGTIVAAGALVLVGFLPSRPEAVVVEGVVNADEIEIVKAVKTTSQDDFILADEAEVVQEDTEETQEEQDVVSEPEEEVTKEEEVEVEAEETEEVEVEVVEVAEVETQNLASEEINEANQSIQQATEQVAPQRPQSQPANNNTGQEEREAEARRAEAARQEEAKAQKRAEEEARKAAEVAKLAEMAKVVADNHNKPNLLLRNGVVVKEGSGRVWYYDGPVDGLSFTDNAGNEIKRNIESITVNESLYDMNGVNYSNYMSGRVAPVVIQTTEVGYILHVFTR